MRRERNFVDAVFSLLEFNCNCIYFPSPSLFLSMPDASNTQIENCQLRIPEYLMQFCGVCQAVQLPASAVGCYLTMVLSRVDLASLWKVMTIVVGGRSVLH